MIKYFKQLAGDSLIYGLSTVISGFISLFLVPVYTRIFAPADYGVINLVNVTFFLINILVVFGLDNSVALWFWDKTEEEERKRTFATWFWFQVIVSISFALVVILGSGLFSSWILSTKSYYYLFIIAGANLPFLATHRVLINWFKYRRKPVPTVVFTLTVSLSIILLSIFLVVYLRVGVKGVFIAQLIASFIGAIIVLLTLKTWLPLRYFDRVRLKEMLRFSAPLVPAALSFWALGNAGSYIIEKYRLKDEVGLYQIGITFSGLVNMVVLAFNQAWPPFALSISKQEGHQKIYANVFLVYITIGCVAATGLWIFSPEILGLLTARAYYDAADVVGILGFNVFIMGIANITTIGCNLAKTNKPYAQAVFVASIVSVALYFALIPVFGKEGAACSTLAGNICLVCYVSYRADKLYPVPYNWVRSILYIALSIASVYLTRYSGVKALTHTGAKILVFLVLLGIVAFLNRDVVKKLIDLTAKGSRQRRTGVPQG